MNVQLLLLDPDNEQSYGSGAGKIKLIFWIEMDLKHYIRGYKLCLYLKRKNIFCEKDILPVEDVLKKGLMSKE